MERIADMLAIRMRRRQLRNIKYALLRIYWKGVKEVELADMAVHTLFPIHRLLMLCTYSMD